MVRRYREFERSAKDAANQGRLRLPDLRPIDLDSRGYHQVRELPFSFFPKSKIGEFGADDGSTLYFGLLVPGKQATPLAYLVFPLGRLVRIIERYPVPEAAIAASAKGAIVKSVSAQFPDDEDLVRIAVERRASKFDREEFMKWLNSRRFHKPAHPLSYDREN